ncbi:sulfite reductase subunit alpha [Phycisphaerales bacterium AB-hyl4]|uniref:Sulfite reductase subunit alpha n=1 Tax=Natronomicrosphaera hydrolytica TaxID=3242702 RepID=A0ABV4U9A2_9BACT
MMRQVPTIPDNAPFNAAQRAWLNGFFAGLAGEGAASDAGATSVAPAEQAAAAQTWRDVDDEDVEYDWHDPAMPMDERMKLAADKPLELRLMAAMAQLDCGSCGYLCRSYAKALADGDDGDMGKCVPGGKQTARMIKQIMKDAGDEAPGAKGDAAGNVTGNGQVEVRSQGKAIVDEDGRPKYGRDHPFPAPTLAVRTLTGETSAKDVRFVSLSIAGSGMSYKAGDSLGVFPKNCYESVDALVRLTGFGGGELVPLPDGRVMTFREALIEWCDIDNPSDELYELLASHASSDEAKLLKQASEGLAVDGLVDEARVIDVMARFRSARPSPVKLVEALDRLQPRLYSIASSPRRYPDEIHLCVGVVRYMQAGRRRKGVASTFLAERLASYEPVPAYVQGSHGFAPPSEGERDVIMVGPGTGIAPFRAFLQEREATQAKGRNWLVFGDQHSASDFLFKDELEQYRDAGVLTRLSTAFSRDQDEKIYVQHRMLEHGAEMWQWLDGGACFYVCGDATRMAGDVDAALHAIIAEHGRMSEAEAKAYVKRMTDDRRYLRDVY